MASKRTEQRHARKAINDRAVADCQAEIDEAHARITRLQKFMVKCMNDDVTHQHHATHVMVCATYDTGEAYRSVSKQSQGEG